MPFRCFMLFVFMAGHNVSAQYCSETELNANKMGFATQFERVMMYLECCCKPDMVNFSSKSPVNDSVFLVLSGKYLDAMVGFPNRRLVSTENVKGYKGGNNLYVTRTFALMESGNIVYYTQVKVTFSKKESQYESGTAKVENIEVMTGREIKPFSKRMQKILVNKAKEPMVVFHPPPARETR